MSIFSQFFLFYARIVKKYQHSYFSFAVAGFTLCKERLNNMRNLSGFELKFDRSVAIYAPGETVSGKVVFFLSAPKSIREIRLIIRGKAKVSWIRVYGQIIYEHSKKEYYFKILNTLAGEKTGDGQTTLPAGQHSYPFSFQLPVEIPYSFEHKNGYIQYTVKAELDKSWSFDNKIVLPFVVLAPYDLSIQQNFATPINEEFEEQFLHFCCFDAGSIKFHVSSHTRGFSLGEMIELIIKYDGSSTRVNITRMKLVLLKQLTFHDSSYKMRKTEHLREERRTGSFGNKGETSLRLIVPPLPPSNLQHCSIIDVNYEVVLSIEISGTHSNVTRSYPVQLWDALPIR